MCIDVHGVMGVINDVRYGSVNVCGCTWCNGG